MDANWGYAKETTSDQLRLMKWQMCAKIWHRGRGSRWPTMNWTINQLMEIIQAGESPRICRRLKYTSNVMSRDGWCRLWIMVRWLNKNDFLLIKRSQLRLCTQLMILMPMWPASWWCMCMYYSLWSNQVWSL